MLTVLAVDVTVLFITFGVSSMYVITIEYLSGKSSTGENQYRLTTVKTQFEDYSTFLDEQFKEYFILDVEKVDD